MKKKDNRKKYECIIIGGGAAGMMAAITLAREGIYCCIIEHTSRIGNKILQTGNGKCNFTNLNMTAQMYQNEDTSKVMSVIERFNVDDTLAFFEEIGVYHKERNGYVYPHSETAVSLNNALKLELENAGVKIHADTNVKKISKDNQNNTFILECENISFEADTIIMATGSKAASKTGSDGSGYELAKAFGIKIIKPLPALVQLISDDKKMCKLAAGVRSTGKIELYVEDKLQTADEGEIQYTDYGISGIPVFQVSRYAVRALDNKKKVHAVIDMLPDISEALKERLIIKRADIQGYKTIEQFFEGMLNKKLVNMVCYKCGIDSGKCVGELNTSKLNQIFAQMKHFKINITDNKGFDNGQICQGGVSLQEVNENLESLKVKGLFFAGEILDVDGKCGGYNLQWAWSSGNVSAKGVINYIKKG